VNFDYKLILLDRDGVVNQKPNNGSYVTKKSELKIFDEVIEVISELSRKLEVAIVTNQQGVGRGLMSQRDLNEIHNVINTQITNLGGRKLKIFACTHRAEDNCACRKPNPGLILDALASFAVSPKETIFIGDQDTDKRAAESAGIHFIKTQNPKDTVSYLKGFFGD
jgi:D-glycero-D-manno-heptose 1,7-bisphosphate phosphatase